MSLGNKETVQISGTSCVVLFAAILIAGSLSVLGVWDARHTKSAWEHIGIPALEYSFGDLRSVLGALDCKRAGVDVYVLDPCDPWGRPFNYPPLWLLLDRTGLGMWAANWVGISMAVAFVAGLLLLFNRVRFRWVWLVVAAGVSPMSLLLIERGNVDIICWLLLLISVQLTGAGTVRRAVVGALLIPLAAALKLYPLFFAVINAMRKGKQALPRYMAVLAGLIAILIEASRIPQIVANTDYGERMSYGYKVLFFAVHHADHFHMAISLTALAAALLGAWLLSRSKAPLPNLTDSRDSALYLVGAATYAGTFLIGANWGYRAVFLLFCYPLLCSQLDQSDGYNRDSSLAVIATILGLVWSLGMTTPAMPNLVGIPAFLVSQLASWILFVVFAAQLLKVSGIMGRTPQA